MRKFENLSFLGLGPYSIRLSHHPTLAEVEGATFPAGF